jgi:hypothetical protein
MAPPTNTARTRHCRWEWGHSLVLRKGLLAVRASRQIDGVLKYGGRLSWRPPRRVTKLSGTGQTANNPNRILGPVFLLIRRIAGLGMDEPLPISPMKHFRKR